MSETGQPTEPSSGEAKILPFVRKERSTEDEWEDTDDATLALKRLAVLSGATYYENLLERLSVLVAKKGNEVAEARLHTVEDIKPDSAEALIEEATRLAAEAQDKVRLSILKFIGDLYATAKPADLHQAREFTEDLVTRVMGSKAD